MIKSQGEETELTLILYGFLVKIVYTLKERL